MDRLFEDNEPNDPCVADVVAPQDVEDHRLVMSPSGHDGSAVAAAQELLRAARAMVDLPDVDAWDVDEDFDAFAVKAHAARAAAYELERAASLAQHEARLAAVQRRRIDRAVESTARRERLDAQKAAGGYYRGQYRSPNRPTHVEVDPQAWAVVKREALRRGLTVAGYVGDLVAAASVSALAANPGSEDARPELRFARLFIADEQWHAFRAHCDETGVTATRGVGLVVEREAHRIDPSRQG